MITVSRLVLCSDLCVQLLLFSDYCFPDYILLCFYELYETTIAGVAGALLACINGGV